MNQPIRIHLSEPPEEEYIKIFESLLDERIHATYGEEITHPQEVDYLIAGELLKSTLEECTQLKGVIVPFAGIPNSYKDLLPEYPQLTIHNLHHNAVPVAENTLALLLSAAKNLIPNDRALRADDWRPRYDFNPAVLLYEKTILILGYGNIGKLIAKMVTAFNMKVLAMRNSTENSYIDEFAQVYPTSDLHAILPKAHFLINTLPLTTATEGLIGKKELSLLPEGAVVVNVGRGKVIDQDALYHQLKNGHLGGAGIDVWYHYPTDEVSQAHTSPADFPFHELDNVVMSPHNAGGWNSIETEQLRMRHLAELVNYAARGEALPNRVDLSKGY